MFHLKKPSLGGKRPFSEKRSIADRMRKKSFGTPKIRMMKGLAPSSAVPKPSLR